MNNSGILDRLRNDPKTSWLGGILLAATGVINSGAVPADWVTAANACVAAISQVALMLIAGDKSNAD